MNPKKPLSEQPWILTEVEALRAETPDEEAVQRAVATMLTQPRVTRTPIPWRGLAGAAASAGAVLVAWVGIRPQVADAREYHHIASLFRAQLNRYQKTYRPGAQGALQLVNEDWCQGDKFLTVTEEQTPRRTTLGFDGHRMFQYTSGEAGSIDDFDPVGFPLEDLDSFLSIPGSHLMAPPTTVVQGGGTFQKFSLDCRTVRMDLFVNPLTRLPFRRDVFSEQGRLIETNTYEYPANLKDDFFEPPSEGVRFDDYPAMRQEFEARINRAPAQSQTVAGIKVTLRAVIVSKNELLAVWTGGAATEPNFDSPELSVEGIKAKRFDVTPGGFGTAPTQIQPAPVLSNGQTLRGDQIQFAYDLTLTKPIKLVIPVWSEDRDKPILDPDGKIVGYHSKLVGHARFSVDAPVFADEPARAVWAPVEGLRGLGAPSGG